MGFPERAKPDPAHTQKGDRDDQVESQTQVTPALTLSLTLTLSLALTLTLTLTLALTLALPLPPPPARPYRPMRSFSAAYARCPWGSSAKISGLGPVDRGAG